MIKIEKHLIRTLAICLSLSSSSKPGQLEIRHGRERKGEGSRRLAQGTAEHEQAPEARKLVELGQHGGVLLRSSAAPVEDAAPGCMSDKNAILFTALVKLPTQNCFQVHAEEQVWKDSGMQKKGNKE